MESAVVRTLRDKAKAVAENKKKKPAPRTRVKILMFKASKKRFSSLKPTPSAVHPCDEVVDGFLAESPPPTRAAMAALPATIGS